MPFFSQRLNWLHTLANFPSPLYSVFHVTLGFKQRTERGHWRFAGGSGRFSASAQQRWLCFKRFPSFPAWNVCTKFTAALFPAQQRGIFILCHVMQEPLLNALPPGKVNTSAVVSSTRILFICPETTEGHNSETQPCSLSSMLASHVDETFLRQRGLGF